MSKSTLAAEVEALQGNTAFLSEFLDLPVFDLGAKATNEEQAELAPTSPKDAVKITTIPATDQIKTETAEAEAPASTVVPKIVMPKVTIPQVSKRNYGGKYVIWTPGKPASDERVLIKKIIEAVGIPASALVLENDTNPEAADWSSSPFVFAFGVTTVPGNLHQMIAWQGTRLLKTCSLAELNADLNQKKALWVSLKQAFKL